MFKRRLRVLVGMIVLSLGVLVFRAGWLQLVRGDYYAGLSVVPERASRGAWIETVRGTIRDCRGRILAIDRPTFELCAYYRWTRLYDARYWSYQEGQWSALSVERREAKRLGLEEAYRQAEALVGDLSVLCGVERGEFLEGIKRINGQIYRLRAGRARRRWYERSGLSWSGTSDIEGDLAARVPDEGARLALVFDAENDVVEAYWPHRLAAVSEEVALLVEERVIGRWVGQEGQDRPLLLRTGKYREYPFGTSACHVIGQVGPAAAEAVAEPNGLEMPSEAALEAYRVDDRRGAWGVEALLEGYLRGRRGWVKRQGEQEVREEAALGGDVGLTLDIVLQGRLEGVLAGDNEAGERYRGGAVVIDVGTGEVRALVSVPTFDLNGYYEPSTFKRVNFPAAGDVERVGLNRAMSEPYMPGSLIKPVLLLGGLSRGVVTPGWQVDCHAGCVPGKPNWACQKYGHGWTGGYLAVEVSCNYYFMELGKKMGWTGLADWLGRAGYGRKVMAWPAEADGAWRAFRETSGYLRRAGEGAPRWSEMMFVCVGLNPMKASVVQMANSMATIARGGVYGPVRLIAAPGTAARPVRLASEAATAVVEEGMRRVVEGYVGTAQGAFEGMVWPGVKVYGKTGSTNYSVFGGYARAEDGRCLAFTVVLEKAGGGGTVAAPVARRLLEVCGEEGYLPAMAEGSDGYEVE